MQRRKFFGKAAAATMAAPIAAGAIEPAAETRYVQGNIAQTPMRDLAQEAFWKALQPHREARNRLERYRGSRHQVDDGDPYHDIMELRSISPAAKRFLIAQHRERRAAEERSLEERIAESVGWVGLLQKLGDFR